MLRDLPYLLPTPTVVDMGNNKTPEEWEAWKMEQKLKHKNGNGHGNSLTQEALTFLPTPVASQGRNATAGRHEDSKHHSGWTLNDVVFDGQLLPTPVARDYKEEALSVRTRDGKIQTDTVPRAVGQQQDWGKYHAAIVRWEGITRPAPAPTVYRNGRDRLNPEFPEWMMGLPAGHITGHGLTATQELKLAGNGVCPQQARLALDGLLFDDDMAEGSE